MSHEHVMLWKQSAHYWHFVRANRLRCIPITKYHQSMRSLDYFFDVNLNELFNNQTSWRWFETPWRPWANSLEMSLGTQKPKHITMTSHERLVVSNHLSFDCLFNGLCWPTSKKHQSPRYWPFERWINRWPVNSQHKEPITRTKLLFDNAIMESPPFCRSNMSNIMMSKCFDLIK